jgi:uncharacterized membrane protein
VTFANPLSVWVLAFVVAAAVALAWYAYRSFATVPRRRYTLVTLRLATLLLVVIFLMRPVARTTQADTTGAVVPILIDTSRSMSIEDAGGGGLRRIDHARTIVERQILPALAAGFQVDLLAFGEAIDRVDVSALSATARRSDLAGALRAIRERYRGRAVAGIVLLSDGGDTSGAAERAFDRDRLAPVYAIGVGSRTVGRDREVLSVTAADAVLDDSRVDLAVSAVSHGHGSAPIELRLLENGRAVEVRRATPPADGTPVREIFHVSPGRGTPTVYTVEIPAAAGEVVPENNARSTLVQPPARTRRVLIVEGAPGFEHSFLKRAWSRDSGLEVDSVVRKGTNEQGTDTFYVQAARSRSAALTSGYPQTAEELFAYDALVLANVDGDQLTRRQLEATRDFVARRGGGLLVLGAQSFLRRGLLDTALEEVLPLELNDRAGGIVPAGGVTGRNRVALTEAGEAHPVMQLSGSLQDTRKRWESVPPLASFAPLGGPRPGASVLAATSGAGGVPRALVAVQRYGEGRSMVFTGEAAWRWRMMLPAADRSYDTFWRQAVRWLALGASDPLAIATPAGASVGDALPFRVVVRSASFDPVADASVDVRVTAPDGRLEQLRAGPDEAGAAEGRFVASYRAQQPGVYRVTAEAKRGASTIGSSTASVLVGGADMEMTDPRLNLHVLQRVASASGGRLLDEHDLGTLGDALRAGVPAAMLTVRRDVWHNGWSLLAIIALLASEWGLRRRWGLR